MAPTPRWEWGPLLSCCYRGRESVPVEAEGCADRDHLLVGQGRCGVAPVRLVPEGLDVGETAATIARWLPQLKGTTVMVDGTREQAPYTRITEEQHLAATTTRVDDGIDEDCASGACPIR